MAKEKEALRSSPRGSGGKASQHGETSGGGSTYFKEKVAHALIKGSRSHKIEKKMGPKSKTIHNKEQETEAKLKTEIKNSKKREKFGKSNLKEKST